MKTLDPKISHGPLTVNHFVHFLQNDFDDMLNEITCQTRRMLEWFQQDEAATHYQITVQIF